jgi:hypothetical protein
MPKGTKEICAICGEKILVHDDKRVYKEVRVNTGTRKLVAHLACSQEAA